MVPKKSLSQIEKFIFITVLIISIYTNCVRCEESEEEPIDDDTDAAVSTESALTDLAVRDDTDLSLWSIARGVWDWFAGEDGDASESGVAESRTFGKIRKLQMAMIPLAFKFGVLSAMITALVFLSLKAIFLLKMLLILNAGGLLAKLITLKHNYYQPPPPQYASWGYSHHASDRSSAPQEPIGKEVHVHIHNTGAGAGTFLDRSDPYSGYSNYAANEPAPAESKAADYTLPYGYSRVGYAHPKK